MQKIFIAFIFFFGGFCYVISSCNDKQKAIEPEGEKLARTHCIACHAFPDPSLLDKETWGKDVLPKMAELMYVDAFYTPYNPSGPQGDMPATRATPGDLFPYAKWEKIVKYYLMNAPGKQPGRDKELPAIETGLKNFTPHYLYDKSAFPLTTLVQFDTSAGRIFFADGGEEKLFVLDSKMKITDSLRVFTGATDINLTKNPATVISMGILKPSDQKLGRLSYTSKGEIPVVIIDSMQRPVQATYADLNNDAKEDIVISEFGFRQGGLSWFEGDGKGHYKKHLLRAIAGATRTEVNDLNKDGKPDIIALMAQGDEAIFVYYNLGDGKFKEERVLQFPPVYGSNYFQLFDFNKDGFMDILITNGDNADYSIVVKAYHGIRIFLNDGKNHFEEKTFLPVYGAQKAIPADMDNDGDIDLVSIAFFPDYEKLPQESFIYWENTGDNTYKRYTFEGVTDGRWVTMDVGDMDKDGDKDVILGNALFTFGNVPESLKDKWNKRPLSIVVLENTLNK
jgi:hypothetical protein